MSYVDLCIKVDHWEHIASVPYRYRSAEYEFENSGIDTSDDRSYKIGYYERTLEGEHKPHYRIFRETDAERVLNIHNQLERAKKQLDRGERRKTLIDLYNDVWNLIDSTTTCKRTHRECYPVPSSYQ